MDFSLPSLKKKDMYFIGCVFLLALFIRIFFLIQLEKTPFSAGYSPDEYWYNKLAWNQIEGKQTLPGAYFMSPGYIRFLVLFYMFFGQNLFLVKLVQACMDSLSVILILLLGMILADKKTGYVSGIFAAVYGMSIFYTGFFLPTALGIFLSVAGIYTLLMVNKRCYLLALLSGLIWGYAILTRANFILFIPFACLWFLILFKKESWKKFLITSCLFLFGITCMLLPVIIHNYRSEKVFMPTYSSGGLNFYIGNTDKMHNQYLNEILFGDPVQQKKASTFIAEQETGKKLSSTEVSSFWFNKTLHVISKNPWQYSLHLMRKMVFFCNAVEWPINVNYQFIKKYLSFLRIPWIPFSLLFSAAFLGIVLNLKNGKRYFLLYSFIFVIIVSNVFFLAASRYRMPAISLFFIFASSAVFWIVASIKKKRYVRGIVGFLLVIIIFFLGNVPKNGVPETSSLNYLGLYYMEQGDFRNAEKMFFTALQDDSGLFTPLYNLGIIYFYERKYNEAAEKFSAALNRNPFLVDAYYNLGLSLELLKSYPQALEAYKRVLLFEKKDTVYFNLGRVSLKMKRPDLAVLILEEGAKRYPDNTRIKELFATAQEEAFHLKSRK